MTKRRLFLLVFLIGVSFQSFSQKVKYKDLFILLSARQYDQAEPFLKRYLKENDDNPNAYLFMGIIYQEKAAKDDVLKNTDKLIQNSDSAIYFYNFATKGITEKELKRNDEYYQMYNRRDLRTGEFGVKLSDVQFDLEKRIQALRDRIERVKLLKLQYSQTELLYSKSMANYKLLVAPYANQKEFFLRADDRQNAQLNKLVEVFDSCLVAFNNYKATSQLLGKTGYNQVLNLVDIHEFGSDGFAEPDFMANDLRLWDYKRWANESMDIITKEIKPIREHLVSYDIEINKLREKLKKDSVSVKSDLTQLVNKLMFTQLKKYDPSPLPIQVFEMKIAELEYTSEVLQNRHFRDSANVQLHLDNTKSEWKALNKLDSITTGLVNRDFDADAVNYINFVTAAYGTPNVLRSLIKTTREFADREKLKRANDIAKREEAFKWLIAGKDSIPLVNNLAKESKFKPLIINESFTSGLMYTDSINYSGYFYSVTPSRIPDIKITFPVEKVTYQKRNLPLTKGLLATDGKGLIYFFAIYSESKKGDKFPITVVKISKAEGMMWANNYLVTGLPSELLFNPETNDLSVKISSSGENKLVVIDKTGKMLK
jgi:hypothetical protein